MVLNFKLIFLFFGLFLSVNDITEDIASALKQGKTTELVKFFDEKITVKLINQEDVLSKSQAEANVKYFFDKHAARNFSGSHISSSNNSTQYLTGILETVNGRFKVSILIKRSLISQFRIENDNE